MAVARNTSVHRTRRKAFTGIGEDARLLGVTRQHLWAVLHGLRHSRSLLQRYEALRGQKKREGREG
jgi:hypothetical protein